MNVSNILDFWLPALFLILIDRVLPGTKWVTYYTCEVSVIYWPAANPISEYKKSLVNSENMA